MKYYLSIIFLIITSNHAFTQKVKDTLYLDENNDFISKLKFDQKINSIIYYGLTFDLEDAVYKKIRFAYFFGKIDPIKKQQLFKYLSARNGVDTTKIMAIHYSDTLRAKYQFPKKDSIVYINNKKNHKHIPPYRTFIKRHKACTKNFKNKKNANVYHYYTVNLGHPKTYKKIKLAQGS
ncbi:hypothetical protein [Aquimarina litoralis]|uniref:hypothetical protein n=1 Tax=Aquimarina litoralis TaxID=584605 RepID=UPI001C573D80|nr:hypothetical protein [Aquimarina litoralis]MBW1295721.1 hypothetical protein [Aquimarina litoralis]